MTWAKTKGLQYLLIAIAMVMTGCVDTGTTGSDVGNTPIVFGDQILMIHSPISNKLYPFTSPELIFTATEGVDTEKTDIQSERLGVKVIHTPTNAVSEVAEVLSGVLLPSMPDGTQQLVFKIDNQGVSSNITVSSFYLTDGTAPIIQVNLPESEVTPDGIWETNDPSPILNYVVVDPCVLDATCKVEVFINGEKVTLRDLVSDPDCKSECLPTLDDGLYTVKIQYTDPAGHVGFVEFKVRIDATPPAIVVTKEPPPPPPPMVTSPIVTATATNGSFTFSSNMDGSAVVGVDSSPVATFDSVTANTAYTVDLRTFPDGVHTVEAVVTETTGSEQGSATLLVILDSTAPSLVVVVGQQDGPVLIQPNISTNKESGVLIFSANESGSAVITLDLGTTGERELANFTMVTGGTRYSAPVTGLTQGPHTIHITATDKFKNTSSTSFSFLVDLNSPAVKILKPADGIVYNQVGNVSVAFEYSDDLTAKENLRVEMTVVFTSKTWNDASGTWIIGDAQLIDVPCCTVAANQDGFYEVVISVTDESNNTTSVSTSFELDKSPPVVGVPSPAHGSVTADNTPQLVVTSNEPSAKAGVQLYLWVGTYEERKPDVDDRYAGSEVDGSLTQGDGTPLADGTYTLMVEITDVAGNMGWNFSTFTVEAVGPEVKIIKPVAGKIYTGGEVTVEYTSHDASDIEVYIHPTGEPLPSEPTTLDEQGKWKISADGDYTVTIKSFDRRWNPVLEGAVASVNFTANSKGVEITYPNEDDRHFRSEETVGLSFNYNPGDTIVVNVDGRILAGVEPTNQPVALDPAVLFPSTGLWLVGSHTITVSGDDAAGNQRVTASFQIITDDSLPLVTISNPAEGANFEAGASVTVRYSVTDDGGEVDTSTIAATLSQNGVVLLTGLNDGDTINNLVGDYTLTVTASDKAGNAGSSSASFNVALPDTTPPVVAISNPADGAIFKYGSSVTLRYGVSDNHDDGAHNGVENTRTSGVLSRNGVVVLQGLKSGDTLSNLEAGLYTFTVTASDRSGNSASDSVSFTILAPPVSDNTPPVVTISTPFNGTVFAYGASVTVGYSVTDNGAVDTSTIAASLSKNGVKIIQGLTNGQILTNLEAGEYAITVSASDMSGNPASTSVAFTMEGPPPPPPPPVDDIAPLVSITKPVSGTVFEYGWSVPVAFSVTDEGGVDASTIAASLSNDGRVILQGLRNGEALSNLEPGSYGITVSASDMTGNSASASVGFTVAEPPPPPPPEDDDDDDDHDGDHNRGHGNRKGKSSCKHDPISGDKGALFEMLKCVSGDKGHDDDHDRKKGH